MKLLVFAHTPPPHHGQSYMVKQMLEGYGGDHRQPGRTADSSSFGITCYHVNARVSHGLEDVGQARFGKVPRLLLYCAQAIWCRFRYGVKAMYYVPAPGKRSAVIRDWVVMALCRPFFPRIILHWHSAGLSAWLEGSASPRTRALTRRLLRQADPSIVLSECNRPDAEYLSPKRISVVPNGIPDPCPGFDRQVLPRRLARGVAHRKLLTGQPLTNEEQAAAGPDAGTVRVLFLANCSREKGLFDAIDGVRLASQSLARQNSALRLKLRVAGGFMDPREREVFDALLQAQGAGQWLEYLGFVQGAEKQQAFLESDVFCFPTYYHAESFGLVLAEAMAFGLPIIATRWRSLPEVLRPDHPGLVDPRKPEQIATALLAAIVDDTGREERSWFLKHFTLDRHLAALAEAMKGSAGNDAIH